MNTPNAASRPRTRRTRFVCVSDTHSASPADGAFKLPKGDVLIHAGDLTNQGSYTELQKTLDWIICADFEAKIVIAGNHDITLDSEFYEEQGLYLHNQRAQNPRQCLNLVRNAPGVTYLHNSSATIHLRSPDGPHTCFTVYGSPCVPKRGLWAFGYDHDSHLAERLWSSVPLETDIVVTHTPPYNHCDSSPKWGAAGCEELRKALWKVRPRLAVCGHVHEARGAERVTWRLDLPHVPFLEEKTVAWIDPGAGTKKMSLLDLTARRGNSLKNDGASGRTMPQALVSFAEGATVDKDGVVKPETSGAIQPEEVAGTMLQHQEALSGRMGRRETAIVNAAIMARSYGNGPKQFNKPIVVDVDLPVWQEGDSQ